jgi:acyl-CoA synthetase (AMP-forming)/AMP-acid ligase II
VAIDAVAACLGAQIIVMDADGHELPCGRIGEIRIHGGSVIGGYWNDPRWRLRCASVKRFLHHERFVHYEDKSPSPFSKTLPRGKFPYTFAA